MSDKATQALRDYLAWHDEKFPNSPSGVAPDLAAIVARMRAVCEDAQKALAQVALWLIVGYEPTAKELREQLVQGGIAGTEQLLDWGSGYTWTENLARRCEELDS